jgi:hypothetical protein
VCVCVCECVCKHELVCVSCACMPARVWQHCQLALLQRVHCEPVAAGAGQRRHMPTPTCYKAAANTVCFCASCCMGRWPRLRRNFSANDGDLEALQQGSAWARIIHKGAPRPAATTAAPPTVCRSAAAAAGRARRRRRSPKEWRE